MATGKNKEAQKKVIRFFSTISDETRLNILLTLMDGAKTVNEIYSEIGREKMTLSAISHQLKQLQSAEVVEYEKKGREKTFSLSKGFCWCILRDAYEHFNGKCGCRECKRAKKK